MISSPEKPTVADLYEQVNVKAKKIREDIMTELGLKSAASYYEKLRNPQKLSPAERAVFAKHFEKEIEEIDWQDADTEAT